MGSLRGRFKSKKQTVVRGSERSGCDGQDDRLVAPSERDYSCLPSESQQGEPTSPIAAETPSSPDAYPSTTHSGKRRAGLKSSSLDAERRYLGVRVKLPVKDMLKTIRLAKGLDPQGIHGKSSKGEKKRVNTHGERRGSKKIKSTKSLEELAFIVEVLEEDLKNYTPPTKPAFPGYPLSPEYSPAPQSLSPEYSPSILPIFPDYSPLTPEYSPLTPEYSPLTPEYSPLTPEYSPLTPDYSALTPEYSPLTPEYSPPPQPLPPSPYSPPAQLPTLPLDYPSPALPLSQNLSSVLKELSFMEGYSSESSDDMVSSPGSQVSHTSSLTEYQSPSPPSTAPEVGYQAWHCTAFFWNQLQHEENLIREVSDSQLLETDENGQIALHRAVTEGRQALVYAIAQRMVSLNSLDLKDSGGKSALHLAAQSNQHMIVEDLVRMGADANDPDQAGKTCMHLSVENGYIRVVEVLMKLMKKGYYIDLEATDKSGLTVLQCGAVSLKLTVMELERRPSTGQSTLQTLRKEQIMETLEYLLQMDNYALDQSFRVGPFTLGSSMEPYRPTQGGEPLVSMEPYRPTQGGEPLVSMEPYRPTQGSGHRPGCEDVQELGGPWPTHLSLAE